MSGVIGIYSKDRSDVAKLAYYGIYAIQHRGQVSSGIVVNNNGLVDSHKGQGLVNEVFSKESVDNLLGNIAIGHVRYAAQHEGKNKNNVQPLAVGYKKGALALSLDGRLTNSEELRDKLEDLGNIFQTDLDAEVIANLIARHHKENIEEAIIKTTRDILGAYSMVIMTSDKLIGARDPYGTRPLSLGKIGDNYILSSETCAFETIGAEFIRDVEPGEIIAIDDDGVETVLKEPKDKGLCLFEYVYLARSDSYIEGKNVYQSRYEAGRQLYRELKTDADIVIGAPDSGIVSAIGYAEESGIPFAEGIVKNRYVGRTFIQPTQELREMGVRIKLNALRENVENKRIILVDDSVVRGTTLMRTVDMLRKAGAKEIHVRISAPPITSPCYLGIDTPTKDNLIAANMSVEEIGKKVNADSLYYLSLEGLMKATGRDSGFCTGCFNENYPV